MLGEDQNLIIPDITLLVDDRSEPIWKAVSRQFSISLQFHDKSNYLCYTKSKNAILYVSRNAYDKDYFAHEILHLYLESKGINIGGYLMLRFKENILLSSIFSKPLLDHISNILDHIKMFQYYLNLGFDRRKFILDYDEPKCTPHEINLLTLFMHSPIDVLWKAAADTYLGKFFSIKGCPNNTIDYTEFLNELGRIDNTLFHMLDAFWKSWLAFDIEKYDIRDYNYWDLCDTLFDSLNQWATNKSIPNT